MADEFEVRVYALLEEFEFGGKAYVDTFKAKGNDARILSDLSEEADEGDFAYALIKLMAEFGVAGVPDRSRSSFEAVFGAPRPIYQLRDLSLGELKAIVSLGAGPRSAWNVRRVSVADWIEYVGQICLFVAAIPLVAFIPLKVLAKVLPHSPARTVIADSLSVISMVFLAFAVLRILFLLGAWAWQNARPRVFERLAE